MAALSILVVACVGSLLGCENGGGGSTQVAPDSVRAGEPATIDLELSVWGGAGKIDGRYSDVAARYRLVGDSNYTTAAATHAPKDSTHETYRFVVPPYPAGGKEIEYYIDLKLDGHPSRIPGIKKIRIV